MEDYIKTISTTIVLGCYFLVIICTDPIEGQITLTQWPQKTTTARPGENVTLPCQVTGIDPKIYAILWQADEKPIISDKLEGYVNDQDFKLSIDGNKYNLVITVTSSVVSRYNMSTFVCTAVKIDKPNTPQVRTSPSTLLIKNWTIDAPTCTDQPDEDGLIRCQYAADLLTSATLTLLGNVRQIEPQMRNTSNYIFLEYKPEAMDVNKILLCEVTHKISGESRSCTTGLLSIITTATTMKSIQITTAASLTSVVTTKSYPISKTITTWIVIPITAALFIVLIVIFCIVYYVRVNRHKKANNMQSINMTGVIAKNVTTEQNLTVRHSYEDIDNVHVSITAYNNHPKSHDTHLSNHTHLTQAHTSELESQKKKITHEYEVIDNKSDQQGLNKNEPGIASANHIMDQTTELTGESTSDHLMHEYAVLNPEINDEQIDKSNEMNVTSKQEDDEAEEAYLWCRNDLYESCDDLYIQKNGTGLNTETSISQ